MIIKNPWNHHLDNSRAGSKQKKTSTCRKTMSLHFSAFCLDIRVPDISENTRILPKVHCGDPKRWTSPKSQGLGEFLPTKNIHVLKEKISGGVGGSTWFWDPFVFFIPKFFSNSSCFERSRNFWLSHWKTSVRGFPSPPRASEGSTKICGYGNLPRKPRFEKGCPT